ncbi:MAG: Nif3-like dinuclear metal center hexameric protein, partial [Rhodothermales bacterium]
ADAFVTADLTYHRFFEVYDSQGTSRMALIDAGHYETEAPVEEMLCSFLSEQVPDVHWSATRHNTNPVKYFAARE